MYVWAFSLPPGQSQDNTDLRALILDMIKSESEQKAEHKALIDGTPVATLTVPYD